MANQLWTELNDQQAEVVVGGLGFVEKLDYQVDPNRDGNGPTVNVATVDRPNDNFLNGIAKAFVI